MRRQQKPALRHSNTQNVIDQLNRFYDQKYSEARCDDHRFAVEKARAILTAYVLFYRNDGFQTALIEDAFCVPIIDPNTNEPIPDCYYTGIIDCMVKKNGQLYASDHKTVGQLQDSYWHELETNPQLTQYMLGLRHIGVPVDGFLWDVIVKPTISPKDLSKKAIAEIENDGTYCGQPLRVPYNGEESETPSLFGLRVLVAYTESPEKFFKRKLIRRDDAQLLEYAEELAADQHDMIRDGSDKSLCRRNLNSCKAFNSLCTFHQLCAGKSDESAYVPKPERPNEHPHVRSGSLSPSRLATYKLCKRKWWYEYKQKIAKPVREYSDALEFGSLVHEGLELYLASKMLPKDEQVDLRTLSEQVLNEFSG